MRIIGGINKKRKIKPPSNLDLRPTTDVAKESIFNIISNDFEYEYITVLDLFAGTGNISYEFASRGVNNLYAVEINNKCVQFIRKQARELSYNNFKVIRDDALHFLSICKINFDIIFADPPFDYKKTNFIHKNVFENQLLKENGWLIIEHGKETNLDQLEGFYEKRKYGKVNFSIFKNNF